MHSCDQNQQSPGDSGIPISDRAEVRERGRDLFLTYRRGDALSMIRFLFLSGFFLLSLSAYRSGKLSLIDAYGEGIWWILFFLGALSLYKLSIGALNGTTLVASEEGLEIRTGPVPPVSRTRIPSDEIIHFAVMQGSSRELFSLVHRGRDLSETQLLKDIEDFETARIFRDKLIWFYSEERDSDPVRLPFLQPIDF